MGEFDSQGLYQLALDSFNQTILVNGFIVLVSFILGFFLSKWSLERTEKLPKDSGTVNVAKVVNIRWSGIAGTTMIIAGMVLSVITINSRPIYSVASKNGETTINLATLSKEIKNMNESLLTLNSEVVAISNVKQESIYLAKLHETNEHIKELEKSFKSFNKWSVVYSAKPEAASISAFIKALNDDDSFVRFNATSALGKIGQDAKVALPVLRGKLQEPISYEEEKAIEKAISEIKIDTNKWKS